MVNTTIKTNSEAKYLNFMKQAKKVAKTSKLGRNELITKVLHTTENTALITDSQRAYMFNGHNKELEENLLIDPSTNEEMEGYEYPLSSLMRHIEGSKNNELYHEVTFNVTKKLVAQLKAVATVIEKCDETGKNADFKITVGQNSLFISKTNPNTFYNVEIGITSDITTMKHETNIYYVRCMYFNEMIEVFNAINENEITLKLYGNLKPLTFESESFFGILMPVRKF